MGDDQKQAFFESVVNELDIDSAVVAETLHANKAAPTRGSYRAFAHASEPKRQELIRRLNQVAGGTH